MFLCAVEEVSPYDCGDDDGGKWITFINRAQNPIRIRTCALDFNKETCTGAAYATCDPEGDATNFVSKNTSVALRLDANVTYVVAEYCVYIPGVSIRCLESPEPLEFYSKPLGEFPRVLEVPAAASPFCGADKDCPGKGTVCKGNVCSA